MTKIVKNLSKRIYQHNVENRIVQIMPGEKAEIPDDIADIWLKTGEIELVADKNELEQKDREIAELKAKLSGKEELQELRAKAKDLGVEGTKYMGTERLKKAIKSKKK